MGRSLQEALSEYPVDADLLHQALSHRSYCSEYGGRPSNERLELLLAPIAAGIGVGDAVLLGKGEKATGGRTKDSILADCLEAIIAAVYLSGGIYVADRFVMDMLSAPIEAVVAGGKLGDAKNRLQELTARLGFDLPSYDVTGKGPDHSKLFSAEVSVGGEVVGHGTGTSKKNAERRAAIAALEALASSEGTVAGG
jgi:ribonuclease-3